VVDGAAAFLLLLLLLLEWGEWQQPLLSLWGR
jgi:hypothetical protein